MAMAMIEFEGERVEFDEDLVKTDAELKESLRPHVQGVENILIERTRDGDGRLVIRVRRNPGTKGGLVATLDATPHDPQLAVPLAQHLNLLTITHQLDLEILVALQDQIDQALTRATADRDFLHHLVARVDAAAAQPGAWIG